jgi:hypothetical protein
VLENFSIGLAFIFAIECLLKIIAYGFIHGSYTYLRSGWNILDFIIVLSSIAGNQFKLIRLIRVLRPLRTIKRIPTLRMHTNALIESFRGVVNVAIFVGFIIYLYGVIGVQLFSGVLYYTCRTTPEPLVNATAWEIADVGIQVCNPSNSMCPEGTFCGSPIDFGLSLDSDEVQFNSGIQYGIGQFDNIF